MDRQAHDYAAAMAFSQQQQQAANIQQQQQFGFHPPQRNSPHQFLFPFHRSMQQPQLQPLPPPHPHLLHLQQQRRPPPAFPPHLPPHAVPPPFHGPYDSTPPLAPPPHDPELQKHIDKLAEYVAKNGPEFEAMVREKEQDNPGYGFLFGGKGHNYYRYKLWLCTRAPGGSFNRAFPSSSIPLMHHPLNPMINPSPLNASQLSSSAAAMMGSPQMQTPFPLFYEPQPHLHSQPFASNGRPDFDQSTRSFKGLSRPLPSDVVMEMMCLTILLVPESIKGAKIWFMQRSPFAPALAEELRDRVFALDDSERQLHIIYLANDILFDS
ncbi:unnamed protein product [Ilex paraguariensis]|uniref:Calcium homeostasis endoplasmic reticulum protein n=1 Tax=Ilex paraguariensis TaxID=185542 RepID=A0ABC8SL36_9AQUA